MNRCFRKRFSNLGCISSLNMDLSRVPESWILLSTSTLRFAMNHLLETVVWTKVAKLLIWLTLKFSKLLRLFFIVFLIDWLKRKFYSVFSFQIFKFCSIPLRLFTCAYLSSLFCCSHLNKQISSFTRNCSRFVRIQYFREHFIKVSKSTATQIKQNISLSKWKWYLSHFWSLL